MENTQSIDTIEAHRYKLKDVFDSDGNNILQGEDYCIENYFQNHHILITVNNKILQVGGVEELPVQDIDKYGDGVRYMGKVMVSKKWVDDCVKLHK